MIQFDVLKNAKRNIIAGVINKGVLMVCPFVERTIIQVLLGAEYLGLSSLFNSLLTVLNLAELGFGAAMIHNMYAPMSEDNTKKINALLNVYKKVYRLIALVVFCVGLLLIPVLPKMIKGSYPSDIQLERIYFVYLLNTVVSYVCYGYLASVLVVSQRDDVQSAVNTIVRLALLVCQVAILLISRSYYAFLLLMPVFTIVNNLWVAYRVHRMFPQYKASGSITGEERKLIRTLVTGSFIQRACEVSRNALDSICISAFLGLTMTAIYNNYFAIMNTVTILVNVFCVSFQGGVGNHVATKTEDENFLELNRMNFIYLWIGGWCSICLLCLYQPFMQIWMGKEMMLSTLSILLLILYFYCLKLGDMITLYFSAKGLWWKSRYRAVIETLSNLVLNVALGLRYGVNGIIAATIIAWFFCNYIWSTVIIFKEYFGMSNCKLYYIYQGRQTLITFFALMITAALCHAISIEDAILTIVFRGLICIVVPNIIFLLAYYKTKNYEYLKYVVLGYTKSKRQSA